LLPEASKLANESLKAEIEKENQKGHLGHTWADSLESIEIKESGKFIAAC
jgi:hypothetical protein